VASRLYGPPTDRRRRFVAQEGRCGKWRVWDRELPGFAWVSFGTRNEARAEADRMEKAAGTGFYPVKIGEGGGNG